MKKIKAVLLGAGNRGMVYAEYALIKSEELEIVACVELLEDRLLEAKEKFNIKDENLFTSIDKFLEAKIEADVVINATMDECHYGTTLKLIDAGYNILLEKPIVNNAPQLLEIQKRANAKGVKIVVCHVLRYAPFYRFAKQTIADGKIGEVLTVEMNEHVWIAHFIDSFVRGKWNSEERCGSSFLLQKSCHDMDLMCWLNNDSEPINISSFGSRSLFVKEKAPKDATEFCYNCPHNATCLYSAQKIHLEFDSLPFQTWEGLNKPLDQITYEEKVEYLKHSTYGKCAYDTGGDICDRQVVQVQFKNGSTGMFTMVGGTSKAGRYLHIVGTKGELEGHLEDNKITLRLFDRSGKNFGYNEEVIDLDKYVQNHSKYAGHGGGDFLLVHDLVRYLNGEASISITDINDSVNGHCLAFASDLARKENQVINFDEFKNETSSRFEKVIDSHVHISMDAPLPETIKSWQWWMEKGRIDRINFLALNAHVTFECTELNNSKCLFLKTQFPGKAYAGYCLDYSKERSKEGFLNQIKMAYEAGFDCWKIIESKPNSQCVWKLRIDDDIYDAAFKFAEDNKFPIIIHVADPDIFFETDYKDGFLTKWEYQEQALNVLKRHPNLILTFAHFGFFGDKPDLVKDLIKTYPGVHFDNVPGPEEYFVIAKNPLVWKEIMEKNSTRFIFGTDRGNHAPWNDSKEKYFKKFPETVTYGTNMLVKDGIYDGRHPFPGLEEHWGTELYGLGLSPEAYNNIVYNNFMRIYGEPKRVNLKLLKEITEHEFSLPSKSKYLKEDKKIILDCCNK